jgi:ribonuclease R
MNELLPRREAVLALLTSRERPLTSREMATRLGVSEGVLPGFGRFLESLAQEGALRLLEGDRYALVVAPAAPRGPRSDPDEYDGVLEMLPGLGGLLRAPDRPEDLRIPAHAVGGALHGDRVLARVLRRGALGPEGEVLRVLLRAPHRGRRPAPPQRRQRPHRAR